MYEENPYPRYNNTHYTEQIFSEEVSQFISIESTKINLQFLETLTDKNLQPNVLIAGCGTGQQVINASRYKNAKITAVDLSDSSLAYAIRKSNEYKMDNIDFKKMDILGMS